MTPEDALAQAIAAFDADLEESWRLFEQSLIDHDAPAELVPDAKAWAREYYEQWRARCVWELRARAYLDAWPGGTVQ